MKKMRINIKDEKGASSVLVLLTVLTFLCILTGVFAIVLIRATGQVKSDMRIQELYGDEVARADEIYDEVISKMNGTSSVQNPIGNYIYDSNDDLDVLNPVGVTLESSSLSNNKINATFKEVSSGYEGINIRLSNLIVGKKYDLRFKFRARGEYWTNSYGNLFGYKLSSTGVQTYDTYDDYIPLNKTSEYKEYRYIFTADQTTKYLIFDVAGFSDGTTNYFDIEGLELRNYTYIKKDGVEEFCVNNNAIDIINTNGVTLTNSSINGKKASMSFSESQAGFEGLNVRLSNLLVGENYRITFKFRSDGQYWSENSYGYIFGYKVSPSEVTNYQDYTNYTTLQKSTNYVSYSIDFVATQEKEYLVFDVAGFSDNTTNYFDIDELYITTIDL